MGDFEKAHEYYDKAYILDPAIGSFEEVEELTNPNSYYLF